MASLPSDTETEHYEHPEPEEGSEGRTPRGVSRGSLALMIAGFALVAAVLIGALAGLRAFIMETPSMGTAAPVGSLVLTAPAQTGDLSVGDIVTFKQDGATETHTHRVISAGSDGVQTKGDINGAPDAGRVDQSRLVGKAFFVSPVLGWVVKMLPIVVVVLLLGFLFTRRVENPLSRFRYRVMAFFFGLAVAIAVVKPLFGAKLLWLRVDDTHDPHATASVVSTGLFPVQIVPLEDKGAASQVLSPTGTVGEAVSTHLDETGHFVLIPQLALTPWWWIGLALFCLTPIVWLGIHARMHRNDPEPDHPADEGPEPEGAA